MRISALALGLIVLTGCAVHYAHPTKTAADFEIDKADCRQGIGVGELLYERCLEDRGWRKQ
jgi:hypothetical protein